MRPFYFFLLLLCATGHTEEKGRDWWFKQSDEKARAGDVTGAIAATKMLLKAVPDDAAAWSSLASLHGRAKQYDLQEKAARRAIALDPALASAYLNLGNALLESGKIADARSAYEKAATLAPADPRTHYSVGLAEERAGKLEAAARQYRKAVETDPRYVNGWYNLAAATASQGKIEEGIAALDRLLAIDPGSEDARKLKEALARDLASERSAPPKGGAKH